MYISGKQERMQRCVLRRSRLRIYYVGWEGGTARELACKILRWRSPKRCVEKGSWELGRRCWDFGDVRGSAGGKRRYGDLDGKKAAMFVGLSLVCHA